MLPPTDGASANSANATHPVATTIGRRRRCGHCGGHEAGATAGKYSGSPGERLGPCLGQGLPVVPGTCAVSNCGTCPALAQYNRIIGHGIIAQANALHECITLYFLLYSLLYSLLYFHAKATALFTFAFPLVREKCSPHSIASRCATLPWCHPTC